MKLITNICITLSIGISSLAYADNSAHDFSINSDSFRQGKKLSPAQVFNGFGCEGDNLSPAIHWQNAPAGTKSFAVTLYDPDAPTGSGFWHWMAVNIPSNVSHLSMDAGNVDSHNLPTGASHIRNDYGTLGFGGACPPAGDNPHRYQLTIYALDTAKIDYPENASPALVGFLINQHRLASTTTTAHYMR